MRSTRGAHLNLRHLAVYCFLNPAALKHQPRSSRSENQEWKCKLCHPTRFILKNELGPLVMPVSLQGNCCGGKQLGKPASLHENQSVLGAPESLAVAVAPEGTDFIQKSTWGPGNARTLFPRTQKNCTQKMSKTREATLWKP